MDAAVVRKVICAMHSVSPPYSMLSSVPFTAAQQKRTGRLQRELGENLRQAEMAMGRLLKEQSHGRRLPGGDL